VLNIQVSSHNVYYRGTVNSVFYSSTVTQLLIQRSRHTMFIIYYLWCHHTAFLYIQMPWLHFFYAVADTTFFYILGSTQHL